MPSRTGSSKGATDERPEPRWTRRLTAARWPAGTARARSARRIMWVTLVAVVVTVWLLSAFTGSTAPVHRRLNASIHFDGFQFTITNRDEFAWRDARIDVNGGLISQGYRYRTEEIAPGHTMTLPGSAFTGEDGKALDPVSEPPIRVRIICTVGADATGMYTRTLAP